MEGKLNYLSNQIANSTSGVRTTAGVVNLPRDLSMVNRKNHHSTTRTGIPLVYHCKLTAYHTKTGGPESDEMQQLFIQTVPQNWVYRNAAVKLHAAREKMYFKNGVTRKERGAYDTTIRYGWDAADTSDSPKGPPSDSDSDGELSDETGFTTWLVPFTTGLGETDLKPLEFLEGTWDTTELITNGGTEVQINLWADEESLVDENTVLSTGRMALASSYLNSRQVVPEDSGDGSDDHPAKFSLIKDLFTVESDSQDEVRDIADDQADNPPYDREGVGIGTACYDLVEAGRTICGQSGGQYHTIYVDVPFGIFHLTGIIEDGSARAIQFGVEVLGTSEMQG